MRRIYRGLHPLCGRTRATGFWHIGGRVAPVRPRTNGPLADPPMGDEVFPFGDGGDEEAALLEEPPDGDEDGEEWDPDALAEWFGVGVEDAGGGI